MEISSKQEDQAGDKIFHENQESLSQTPRLASLHVMPEMDNSNRNFKGQQKHETVHCFCRKHWVVLLPHFLIFLGAAAVTAAFFFGRDFLGITLYRVGVPVIILGFTYSFHTFFLRIFNYYLQILIITNFRVIQLDQTLFFHRTRNSIDLPEIQDIVIYQKGILKTLLGFGEVIITLSSAHATKEFQYIPNPEYHFRKINKTKREYISSRRMQKGFSAT